MTTEKYDKKKAHTATHTHKNYNKITFCHIYNSWALNKIMKDQKVCQNSHLLFYAQSPDFHKLGLCYYLKILYL